MRAVTIDPPLDPRLGRAVLRTLFPQGGEYLVQDPSSAWARITFSAPPSLGDDVDAVLKAVFPRGGRYVVAQPTEVKLKKEAFNEWFLEQLVDESHTRYTSTRQLIRRVMESFIRDHEGSLTEPENFARFEKLLFDLRSAGGLSIGMPVSVEVRKRLEELGFSEREIFDWPALAYRFGKVAQSVGPSATFSWARAMALAQSIDLTQTERAAMAYARQHAGLRLTPVILREPTQVWEAVAAEEQRLLRIMTRQAIRGRQGALSLARQLYEQLDKDGVVSRDWERVARTEIANARNAAAWDLESRRWEADERIYRETSAQACSECLRLYKEKDGSPRAWLRSAVEAEDRLGPNRAKPYHAMIGATHPNCACGPWQKAPSEFVARMHREKFGQVMAERGLGA